MNIDVIDKLVPIYQPCRYKVLYGGRASGKSLGIADFLLIQTAFSKKRVLCCREFQSSIKDSVHRVLSDRIEELGLSDYFIVTRQEIRSKCGSVFIFKGLAYNYAEIKSTEGIDYCWIEEAERLSPESWEVLIPTIRKEGSEIIISFNPADESNATYQRFIVTPPQNSLVIKINYYDNPFLPEVLWQEIEYDKKYNPDKYCHIWEGECKEMSNSVVFKDKFSLEEFDYREQNGLFYFADNRINLLYGQDYGFSHDPHALIEMFLHDDILYIRRELYEVGLELNDIPKRAIEEMPNVKNSEIYGDNSRPDIISYLNNHGLIVKPADKGKGSVESGIEFLRSLKKIIIHPDCINTAYEFKSYSYKVDNASGKILPILVDKDNHAIDAIRYGIFKHIKSKVTHMTINPEAFKW